MKTEYLQERVLPSAHPLHRCAGCYLLLAANSTPGNTSPVPSSCRRLLSDVLVQKVAHDVRTELSRQLRLLVSAEAGSGQRSQARYWMLISTDTPCRRRRHLLHRRKNVQTGLEKPATFCYLVSGTDNRAGGKQEVLSLPLLQ